MDKRPIGVMDSGIGGLTVVKVLQKELPNESIVFVGDQARLPYGTRSTEEIQQFSLQIAHFLQTYDIKLMIIACNTATAAALDYLRAQLPIPVIGVISPGSHAALKLEHHQTIGVIGTNKTIESKAYSRQINDLDSSVNVIGLATQEFVTLVEKNQMGTEHSQSVITQKMQYFNQHRVDALILGCTHFPLLANEIKRSLDYDIPMIDAGAATAEYVKSKLIDLNAESDANTSKTVYFTTGNPNDFRAVASKWLENDMLDVSNIKLGD
ncbi:glutamate racemase [Paucilactobacillus suebicus]|uniref:Glutamate racemase n=1 Tax=Paucilactobacillus suebicus DSM 5007 = KCTC 3549 TaxID=1423807 RepID=A0A0R1WEY9_9LACO|nr:glutamate racemase [Paucilactobacillus suebicus]KRM13446.1 glutamate racemase [Paucilactobacillus suebicus DSM 5007 = KCTC 3549]